MNPRPCIPAAFLLLAVATALRTADLDRRVMHTDEAVHAHHLDEALSTGRYTYSPLEYHGPTLIRFTLPIARLSGAEGIAGLDEAHLRIVPALAGVAAIGLLWLMRDGLGRPATLATMALLALSPAMVYYSRYYIMEMLLACFSVGLLGCAWRWWVSVHARPNSRRHLAWAAGAGLCIGLMHATKETWILSAGAMGFAVVGAMLLRARGEPESRPMTGNTAQSGALLLVVAVVVAALLYGDFGHDFSGLRDSLRAFGHYLGRAGGTGSAAKHEHPWHYYLHILVGRVRDGRVYTELPILLLGGVGIMAAIVGRPSGGTRTDFARFLCVYTVVLTATYSAIPYKTPWCLVNFLLGWCLLGGIGAAALWQWGGRKRTARAAVAMLLLGFAAVLGGQVAQSSFTRPADHGNPYAYAHTHPDVLDLSDRVHEIVARSQSPTVVYVFAPEADYWPLPWYFRDIEAGFFTHDFRDRPSYVAIARPGDEPHNLEREAIFVEARPRDWQLRPGVPVRLYVRQDIRESQSSEVAP